MSAPQACCSCMYKYRLIYVFSNHILNGVIFLNIFKFESRYREHLYCHWTICSLVDVLFSYIDGKYPTTFYAFSLFLILFTALSKGMFVPIPSHTCWFIYVQYTSPYYFITQSSSFPLCCLVLCLALSFSFPSCSFNASLLTIVLTIWLPVAVITPSRFFLLFSRHNFLFVFIYANALKFEIFLKLLFFRLLHIVELFWRVLLLCWNWFVKPSIILWFGRNYIEPKYLIIAI